VARDSDVPRVAGVCEAAVVGRPEETRGEVLVAVAVGSTPDLAPAPRAAGAVLVVAW
jgi:acyl-coenzyme A synthetase/AMP-(fatty) acid ligase